MAENNVEPEHEWSDRALDTAEDTLVAMETLLATLRAFEDVLRQQDISVASSTEYCDNFCQVMCTCNIDANVSSALAHPGLFFSQLICDGCWPADTSPSPGWVQGQAPTARCIFHPSCTITRDFMSKRFDVLSLDLLHELSE